MTATARTIAEQIADEFTAGWMGGAVPVLKAALVDRIEAALTAARAEAEAERDAARAELAHAHNARVVAEDRLRMMTENALSLKLALETAKAEGAREALEAAAVVIKMRLGLDLDVAYANRIAAWLRARAQEER